MTDEIARLRQQLAEITAREAAGHDVLSELWSLTNPEEVAPELLTRLHRVLGATEDQDGHCGNDICKRLSAAEAALRDLRSAVAQIEQEMKHELQSWLVDWPEAVKAWQGKLAALQPVVSGRGAGPQGGEVMACRHANRRPYEPESSVGDESDYQSQCRDCGQVLRDPPTPKCAAVPDPEERQP